MHKYIDKSLVFTKKVNFVLLLLLTHVHIFAQEMIVKSVEVLDNDISARTNPCFDINGDPCALVKVNIVAPNVTFEGNVVSVVPKEGQYWVYLLSGSKNLTITQPMLLPCKINFVDKWINGLNEKTTYSVTITLPEYLYALVNRTDNGISGTGIGSVSGGWIMPEYAKVPSTVTGSIRFRVNIDHKGQVNSIKFAGGDNPAASDPRLRQAVESEIRSRQFTRGNSPAPEDATAFITFRFRQRSQ